MEGCIPQKTVGCQLKLSNNALKISPNKNCLIWGASGGLGNFAIQLVKMAGANPIANVSSDEKVEIAKNLGAKYVINRKKENFGNFVLENGEPNYLAWQKAKNTLKH